MTYKIASKPAAMTAIAAAIALSSTPLIAQEVETPPDPVATTTETPVADPLAPEAAPEASVATDATVPAAPKPKVEASAAKARPTKPVTTRSAAPAAPRKASAPPAASQAPIATSDTAVEAAPLPLVPQAPTTAEAVPPPAPVEQAPTSQALSIDEVAPAAGAAALGLLLLGGTGFAMRRRRRRRECEEFETRQQALEAETVEPVLELGPAQQAQLEPTFARTTAPVHDPVPQKAPGAELPSGFDISRFGPHVQAAYRGPTPDNPSLSLKNRLRRASFFDQQERREAKEAAMAPAKQAWPEPRKQEFMLRPAASNPAPKPAYQS